MEKDFEGWNQLKQRLHSKDDTHIASIKEREIWWCSVGVNIGNEEDGHNERYNRPVLIIRKFNRYSFWGVPLTSRVKESRFYYPLEIKGKKACAMLSQLKLYDCRRLHGKMIGKLPDKPFAAIKTALVQLLQ